MIELTYPTAFSGWGDEERAALERVIASDRFTMGKEVEAFEDEFARYHGMRHAVMVNSGSSANLLCVAALFQCENNPLRRGDRVLVPALAWPTTYAPLVQHGLEIELIDCDATWNAMRPSVIGDLEGVRLIVGCSVLGNPAYLTEWQRRANKIGAHFIEDNCESIGAADGHRPCGTTGIGNSFSFFWSHQLSAIEGGCILTNDEEYADTCRMLRNHGWSRGVFKPQSFEEEYDFRLFGYNVRPLEMHAAVAREQLKKLDARIAARAENYAHWRSESASILGIFHPEMRPGYSPFGIHFLLPDRVARGRVAEALRGHGIDCRPAVGGSFTRQPYGKGHRDQDTPCADYIHDCGMLLGNAPYPMPEKIDAAVKVIKEVL